MTRLLVIVFTLALAAWGYWHFLHTPTVLKRHTEQALMAFAETVATKDRAKISEHLKTLLSEQSTTHLEVTMLAFVQQEQRPLMQRDFTKQEFIPFLDNTLYPLTDYSYTPMLQTFVLSEDAQTATVGFSSKEWGDGTAWYGGTGIAMRYSSDTACNANVRFIDKQLVIEGLSCVIAMRAVPKPGEAQKLQQSPEAFKEIMR